MRICVMGNSHAASLRNGWVDVEPGFPDLSLIFFVSNSGPLRTLAVTGSGLGSQDPEVLEKFTRVSGGMSVVQPGDYDVIVLYGLCRVPRLELGVSSAVRDAAVRGEVQDCVAQHLLGLVRSVSTTPVVVGPAPLISPLVPLKAPRPTIAYQDAALALQAGFAGKVQAVLLQPQETIAPDHTTWPQYAARAVDHAAYGRRLIKVHRGEQDTIHMGPEFGVLWWRMNLARIIAAGGPR